MKISTSSLAHQNVRSSAPDLTVHVCEHNHFLGLSCLFSRFELQKYLSFQRYHLCVYIVILCLV